MNVITWLQSDSQQSVWWRSRNNMNLNINQKHHLGSIYRAPRDVPKAIHLGELKNCQNPLFVFKNSMYAHSLYHVR